MERGLHFGNVSISLVLLLLLKALTGFGTSLTQGSAIGREPQSAARGSGSTSEDDGTGVMKRGLGNVGAPVIVADVTVEDDDNGSAGENDESYGESSGNFRPTRCVQVHTARCDMQAIEQDTHYRTISLVPRWKLVLHPVYNAEYLFIIRMNGHGGRVSADMWEKTSLRASSDGNRVISSRGGGREEREGKHRRGCMCSSQVCTLDVVLTDAGESFFEEVSILKVLMKMKMKTPPVSTVTHWTCKALCVILGGLSEVLHTVAVMCMKSHECASKTSSDGFDPPSLFILTYQISSSSCSLPVFFPALLS